MLEFLWTCKLVANWLVYTELSAVRSRVGPFYFLLIKMQTFLPYPDIEKSLECLDRLRLGKQRVEAYQILNILLNRTKTKEWRNHPAVKMWEGHTNAL